MAPEQVSRKLSGSTLNSKAYMFFYRYFKRSVLVGQMYFMGENREEMKYYLHVGFRIMSNKFQRSKTCMTPPPPQLTLLFCPYVPAIYGYYQRSRKYHILLCFLYIQVEKEGKQAEIQTKKHTQEHCGEMSWYYHQEHLKSIKMLMSLILKLL